MLFNSFVCVSAVLCNVMMKLVIVLFGLLSVVNAAKILVVFPTIAHSHFTIGNALAKELANKGHNVTFATSHEQKEPHKNVKTIFLSKVNQSAKEKLSGNVFEFFSNGPILMLLHLVLMGPAMSELTFKDPAIQAILDSNETYDAVIAEAFVTDSLQGIAYRLKASSILTTTVGPGIWTNYVTGAPSVYSYMPHPLLGFGQRMTFWERIQNILMATTQSIIYNFYYLPKQNTILHKYVPEAPSLSELIQNTSLHLYNSDPVLNGPIPIFPNTIEIGGIHIGVAKKLPDDLQKYLDETDDGVIYFSMGGNLRSKDLPQKTRESMLRVFSKLKQRVLWKFEEDLPDKSKNVEIRSWLPQRDILVHPNIKIFITHGGLLSTTESLYSGVPVVGIPVFGDQALNMKLAVNRGYGISVPFTEFTEEKFSDAINEMLRNPSYSQKAKEMSVQIKDKPITQLDKATYWIEYVIRHKGAHHFKTAAHDLAWYQYYSIDVVLFLALIGVVLYKVARKAIKLVRGKNKEKQKRN